MDWKRLNFYRGLEDVRFKATDNGFLFRPGFSRHTYFVSPDQKRELAA